MEELIKQVLESSVGVAISLIVLWIFLPRLIKQLDEQTVRNTKEHETIVLMLTHLELRMNWHEAKMYNINTLNQDNNEYLKLAQESFEMANMQTKKLRMDIRRLFGDRKPMEEME